jgi:hypothetical protein
MVKKMFFMLICFISLTIFISTLHGQGSKKTITLPSGEVVCDLNGEWDAFVENYGVLTGSPNYSQIMKITQTGSSFVAIRMTADSWNKKGSQSLEGELDKSGIKKVTVLFTFWAPEEGKGQISDDGNKIIIKDDKHILTLTRK